MEDNTKKKGEQQVGEQNPTLDAPGSQVSDYGNVEGGAGSEDARSQRPTDKADRQNIEPLKGNEETAGNP
jgi:hypothetical protein